MATLVAGTILSRIASDWDGAKWFFVTNLPLPEFYAGMPAPFEGMTLTFSTLVLAGWAVGRDGRVFRGLHAARRHGLNGLRPLQLTPS